MSKIQSRVLAFWRSSPLTRVELQIVRRNLIRGRDPWSHRTERVECFAQKPLAILLLAFARGHVVDNGVAQTWLMACARLISRPCRPITTVSSPS
jgi:hypothetical protein